MELDGLTLYASRFRSRLSAAKRTVTISVVPMEYQAEISASCDTSNVAAREELELGAVPIADE